MSDAPSRPGPGSGQPASTGERKASGDLEKRIAVDLAALRSASARDLPELHTTMEAVRRRRPDPGAAPWKIGRRIMSGIQVVRARPALAVLAAAVLVVVGLMVIPVSYDRVAGHDVSLSLGGPVDRTELGAIARDLKSRIGAGSVAVEAEAGEGAPRLVLRALSPERSRGEVTLAAEAFARELAGKGYSASVQVSPRMERVRYPVAAYAWDQIIQISVDGKSASELESEIRQRLAEAGVRDAQVSVTDQPDGGRNINLRVERRRTGDPATMEPEPPMPQLVLTKDGAPLSGDGFSVKVQKRKLQGGPVALVVEVTSGAKTAKAEVPNAESMSDADLAAAIDSQLRAAGIEVRVSVQGGKVEVESLK